MAHSTTQLTDAVDAAQGLELYERMALIRRFEDAVQSLFQKGEVHGTTHLYSGQEAGAVGVCSVSDASLTGRPGPIAGTATRWPWAWTPRRSWPSCWAARPACAPGGRAR